MSLFFKLYCLMPWKKKIKFFFFKSFLKIFFYSFFVFFYNIKKIWLITISMRKHNNIFNLLKSSLRYKRHKHQFKLNKTFLNVRGCKLLTSSKKTSFSFLLNFFLNNVFNNFFLNWGSIIFIKFLEQKFLILEWCSP